MHQTTSMKEWTDEAGSRIPISRIRKSELIKERHSQKILKEGKKINAALRKYKQMVAHLCAQAYEATMDDLSSAKTGKGNFTWFNFDRSIKIEVSVSERIEFDDLTIEACKSKLNEFIETEVQSKTEFVKEMILKAFEKQNGKLDSKKILPLLRYKSRIPNKLYQEAMKLLEESIRRPSSRTYFRVWELAQDGSYQNIDLNLSSIT